VVTTDREPWLAVLWSRVWPGLGQLYAGAKVRGLAIALGCLGLAISSLLSLSGTAGLTASGAISGGLLLLLVSIWSWFDAYWVARKQNSADFEAERQRQKDPWLAVFWTTLWLGAGHLYVRRYVLGGVLIAIGVICLVIPLAWLLLPFVAIHAYRSTPGDEARKAEGHVGKIILLVWLLPLLLGIIPAFGIRTFVAEARFIPSGSMLPTLEVHDRLLIDKLAYRFGDPQRGDIAVFNPTEALQQQDFEDAFIKRIIGLPGESIEIKQKKVFVDGEPLDEPYILEPLEADWKPEDLDIPKVIPPDHYFVLGDNRNNSYSSHYWGYVPREKLVGRATQRFWPLGRAGAIAAPDFSKAE